MSQESPVVAEQTSKEECFVIMPISDPDGYDKGHFQLVYDDLIAPAVRAADYKPNRADETPETNIIHLDILDRILNAPMAICDLSSRNPNVFFELGIRQAFDKPVVLIAEHGTPRTFDTDPLRCIFYNRSLKYRDVCVAQSKITEALKSTAKHEAQGTLTNSLVKLLAIGKAATMPSTHATSEEAFRHLMLNEIRSIKEQMSSNAAKISAQASEGATAFGALVDSLNDEIQFTKLQIERFVSSTKVNDDPSRLEALNQYETFLMRISNLEQKLESLPKVTRLKLMSYLMESRNILQSFHFLNL